MRVTSLLCACLVFLSALLAGIGEWCPDGCCTEDSKAGVCQSTDHCNERSETGDQSVSTDTESDIDCCVDLSDDVTTSVPKTNPLNDDLQPDALGVPVETLIVLACEAPTRQERLLIPLAIGPPWPSNKAHIELLI